jgi:hypothetical protein
MYSISSVTVIEHAVPEVGLALGLPCLLALLGLVLWIFSRRALPVTLSPTHILDQSNTRDAKPGIHRPIYEADQSLRYTAKWSPSTFELPETKPILEPLEYIRPFPYRPFRAGPQQ